MDGLGHRSIHQALNGVITDGAQHLELGEGIRSDVAFGETKRHYSSTNAVYSS